ncbi:PEP-CTERM protein-sorting domain-containing protein [Paucidesulfovibrio gracilis DSM 16080]|uniref:PEP-CTERM protein-sorting domain-containing protein n=1 Tax=Paucidesulfovibrio gracilis DSM 16080 TaxID=1121449 RepID=A0A1T4WHR4_9BACT|nr:hypothetical protein [Paucidesulfovibrio gracilis]SKA76876.1 PEP-CTERM protein-sorting domain-containing protein [Paucidesulfovibrio gracilis DSM 16080]
MQGTILFSTLIIFGAGLSLALLRRLKSRGKHCTGRMPIDLDFDAAKSREQNRT